MRERVVREGIFDEIGRRDAIERTIDGERGVPMLGAVQDERRGCELNRAEQNARCRGDEDEDRS
jgi:hypothetical protein